MRHGRTAWNAEGRAQGHADVSLDDTGRREAEAMADVLAERVPALLVSSDLARARETAAFLEKSTGLTAVEDPRLREYDLGERTGLTREEFGARLGDDVEGWSDPHGHVVVPGAETHEDVAARIVPAPREVLDSLGPDETALVVLHGAASGSGWSACWAGRSRPPRRSSRCTTAPGPSWPSTTRDGSGSRRTTPRRQLTPIRFAGRSLAKIPGVAQRDPGGDGAVAQLVAHLHGMQGVRC